jgi:hypothetical protein
MDDAGAVWQAETMLDHAARPLSGNEKGFWKLGEASPLNFGLVAHVRPGLDPERVQRALGNLQARHPLLNAKIELRAGKPWFVWGGAVGAIPVEVERVARAEWKPAADRAIKRVIPWDRAPLARVMILDHGHGGDGHTILLIVHHAIGDGMCGAPALRDVLWESVTGRPVSNRVYTQSVPAEEALPKKYLGVRGGLRRVGVLAGMARDVSRTKDPLKCPVIRAAAPHERTYHSELRALDVARTSALTARARAQNTTVQGAVGAALLMGVARLAGLNDERPVTLGSPINLRNRLAVPVGEQMGLYLGVSQYRGLISPRTQLWGLARAIRARIADDLDSGRALASLPLSSLFYDSLGGDKVTPQEFGRRWAATNGTTGLTNIGRVAVEAPPGLTIERVHAIAFPSGLDVFNTIGSAYGGSMMLSFNWCEPCFDAAMARSLFDDVVALIGAAVDGDPALGARSQAA